ncbi:MAG: hypothetical protein EOO41_04150, partial [Methanobacteriota archaeon]
MPVTRLLLFALACCAAFSRTDGSAVQASHADPTREAHRAAGGVLRKEAPQVSSIPRRAAQATQTAQAATVASLPARLLSYLAGKLFSDAAVSNFLTQAEASVPSVSDTNEVGVDLRVSLVWALPWNESIVQASSSLREEAMARQLCTASSAVVPLLTSASIAPADTTQPGSAWDVSVVHVNTVVDVLHSDIMYGDAGALEGHAMGAYECVEGGEEVRRSAARPDALRSLHVPVVGAPAILRSARADNAEAPDEIRRVAQDAGSGQWSVTMQAVYNLRAVIVVPTASASQSSVASPELAHGAGPSGLQTALGRAIAHIEVVYETLQSASAAAVEQRVLNRSSLAPCAAAATDDTSSNSSLCASVQQSMLQFSFLLQDEPQEEQEPASPTASASPTATATDSMTTSTSPSPSTTFAQASETHVL